MGQITEGCSKKFGFSSKFSGKSTVTVASHYISER